MAFASMPTRVIVRCVMSDKCFYECGKEAQRATLLLPTRLGGYNHTNNVVRACRACVKRLEDEGTTFFIDSCPKCYRSTEPYKAELDTQVLRYRCSDCDLNWGTNYSMITYVKALLKM